MKHSISSNRTVLLMFALLLASWMSRSVLGQEGPIVRSIHVEYVGPKTVSKERILSQMRTEVGKPYSEAVVEQDIRNLYKMGELQNVRIFGRQEGDGVGVSVIVQARSIVTAIVINGVHQLKPRKVRDEIKFKLDRPVSEQALEEGRQKIVDLYQRLGFTEVSVHYRLETDESHGTTQAIYDIDEGERGMINAVRFEGNHAFSERTLRHQMKTKPKTIISFLDKSGRLEETQFQEDLDSIRAWYQDHGYVDVEIKDVRKERTKGHLALVIVVNEGTRYHVGKIRITGYHVTSESKIRALLKMKEGNVYSPKALKDDAKNIADAYGAGGFVDVNILPQSIPSAPGRIDIDYKIEEGVRSFVQRINIVGNTRTKDKVLRREILIVPGDVYNTVRVETSQKRLENLGYFSKVETYPEDSEVPGRKDLTIEVAEKRTGSLNFGAGFSTIDSLVGFVELSQGNFDVLNWPTFTGGGQKFRLRIQYGTERKDFLLALSEPYFLDRVLSLGGQAFYNDATYLSSIYSQRDYGFAVNLSKPITPFLSVSVDYRLEDLEIYNIAAGSSSEILAEKGSTVKSEVSFTLVWDTRDNPFLTRTGHRISFTPYIAGGFLGGDTQIYGFELEAAQYFHLWWDTILLLNGEIASVDTWGSGDMVHIFDRLFLGGSSDLRGFNFRDVGPKDVNGEPLGGQSRARATVEYTVPIIEHVRGAVFFDIGLLDAAPNSWGTEHVGSDVGVGVRLDLPIGPLRIDYGIPLQKDGNSGSGKFNFNVGYQF